VNKTFTRLATAGALLLGATQVFAACDAGFASLETTPNARFNNNGDGTITDADTGLMWMQCAAGKTGVNDCTLNSVYAVDPQTQLPTDEGKRLLTWQGALNYAEAVNTQYLADPTINPGGYADWRLPNMKELESLVERCSTNPSINTFHFTANTLKTDNGGKYWSSTPAFLPDAGQTAADVPFQAWSVDFYSGNDWREHKSNSTFYVRLVRTAN
jgi:hypothetical protein